MKTFVLIIMLCMTFPLRALPADDIIKVLMFDNPNAPLPSEEAQKIDELRGKLIINGQTYSGHLEIIKDKNGLYVINNLPFEEYIAGVVASEIGNEWEIEVLKTQAVISRTYAAYFRTLNEGKIFHLTSSVLHQLYNGKNSDPLITYAVKSTKGEILTYGNAPIKAFFHSTCTGKTELPEEIWEESYPYLISVDCNSKSAPYDTWQRRFSRKEISDALGLDNVNDMVIYSYTATGRVKTLITLAGKNSPGERAEEIKATELRKRLGYKRLPSTHFMLENRDGEFVFRGSGFGHGVGLSQWGARKMAKDGTSYRDILNHYYPGTTLKQRGDTGGHDLASKISD